MMKTDDQLFHLYRNNLQAMLELMNASMAGIERFNARQLEAIDQAMSDGAGLAKRIESAKKPEELYEIQTDLARGSLEQAMQYWSGVREAATQNYLDAMKLLQAGAAQASEDFQKTIGTPPAAVEPFMSALQSWVKMGSSAYALTTKATGEAARMASTANAPVRHASAETRHKAA
jgi:phasin family protein